MKKLNKILLLLLVVAATFTLTACSSNVEGELSDIMEKVYEKVYSDVKEEDRPMVMNINPLDEETSFQPLTWYIGTEDIEYKEVLASEAMVGAIPYSVVLVRMKEGADVEAAKSAIKENVNPRKWVCVGVEPEDVIIKSKGDLIILIMVENETLRTKLEEGFDNL